MDPLHDAMRHGCCTELDRLREENARLKAERDAALTHGPEDMVRALEELTRERDEARAALAALKGGK